MKRLVWLYQSSIPKGAEELAHSVDSLGFNSIWIDVENANQIESTTHEPYALLLAASDPRKLQKSDGYLKSKDFSKPNIPKFWIHDALDLTKLSWLADLPCDDFFPLTGNPGELAVRLNLRSHACFEKAKHENQALAHSLDLAKTETIVKQREEFLSVCAHDLRSPLGLIQTSLTMLLKGGSTFSSFQTELIERAKRQATQAVGLVNDLLDVMAYEQGLKPAFQLLDLHAFLSEFNKDYSLQAQQKNISFHYENPIPHWQVLADEDRLRQLLQNLFTNAVKFTGPGKNIYLKVSSFNGRRRTDPAYPMLILSIRDEGNGIPPEELKKIFDRFSQVKTTARAEGRGLGLTVAKQISNLHDGNLWVQSEVGKGSTFFVLLPHVVSETTTKEWRKSLILTGTPSDDLSNQLREWGYEVICARDGVEAVTLAFFNKPAAILLRNELAKLSENDVATILKMDPRIQGSKVLILNERGSVPSNPATKKLFDGVLSLPLKKQTLENFLAKT